jgi:hypothetical protein
MVGCDCGLHVNRKCPLTALTAAQMGRIPVALHEAAFWAWRPVTNEESWESRNDGGSA